MSTELLLDVKNLHVGYKVYNGISKVINGINIKMWPSEKIGIVGETGCGKTTTMRAIMRTLAKNSLTSFESKIFFEGKDILKMKRLEMLKIRREKISMVFEDPTASLNPVFSIGTQLNDILKYSCSGKNPEGKKLKREDLKQQVIQVLKNVYLPDPERILQSYPIQLSGGMRQRVCIAMALISNKKLLIFDEPGTSLDVTIKEQIFKLIAKKIISEEKTSVIFISHNLGDVRNTTERLYVMYAGSIVEVSNTKEFFDELPLHPYSKGLLLATPRLSGGMGKGISGHIPSYLNPPKGCRFHPRCTYRMPICSEKMPPTFNISDSHQVACWLFKDKGVTINEN